MCRLDRLPFVSVIIPTYHDWNKLTLCIEALKQQTYPQERFEVLVVNNDPEDMPSNLSLPANCKLIVEARPGSYAARNAAIRLSKGEILAFTDSDCIPYPNWVEECVKLLESSPDIERVAGKVELYFKSDKLSFAEIYEKVFAFPQKQYASNGISVTANLATYRSVMDKVGLFNDCMMSGGDTEWSRRAQIQGSKIVYGDNCVVKHPARYSISELTEKARRISGGNLAFERESGERSYWLVRGLLPPVYGVMEIARSPYLSVREKVIASLVRYFLKVYTTWHKVLLCIGINEPPRK